MTATVTADISFAPLNGAHWLHPQKTSRIPRRYVFFDTEAHRDETATGESQRWRLGVSCFIKWREGSRTWSPVETVRHGTQESLIDFITDKGRVDARTVVVAHNLAYDLRIGGLLSGLLGRGWRVEKPTFTSEHVSFEAAREGKRLVFVDSLSLLPASLAKVGGWLGVPKLPLPDEDATAEEWYQRCELDVEILSTAYMHVIEWLRSNDLGGWARTGASIGWHSMLRRHLAAKVLVHGRSDVRAAESQAMYSSRCEVWRHGVLTPGPLYEWDFALAYGHICAEVSPPAQLLYEVHNPKMPMLRAADGRFAHLCHALVETNVPVLPARDEHGVYWPCGTFEGWYWDNELREAERHGVGIQVHRAYRYRATPWLSSWATWAMGLVDDDSTPKARVIGAVAKHWTRAVPGRSAMKYRSWEDRGAAWVPGVSYMPLLDLDTGARGAALQLGDRRWEAWKMEWWADALPQLLSYVMAETRIRLWQAMVVAGLENVVYVDTDCLIVTASGNERISSAVRTGNLGSLRPKARHILLELVAPQLVEGSTYRRLSGVPRGARRTAQSAYDAEIWEGLTTSMAEGHPERVMVRRATFDIRGIDTRRVHLPGGETVPFSSDQGVRRPAVA